MIPFFWRGFPMTFEDQTHILFFNIVQQSLFSSGFVYPFQILWRNPQIDVGMTRGTIFTITWSMSIFSHIHIINSQELTQVGLENVSLRRRAVMIFCFLCPMASSDAWLKRLKGGAGNREIVTVTIYPIRIKSSPISNTNGFYWFSIDFIDH